jgi:hypothetical protein
MKGLLIAAGIAGIAYYLKRNPQVLDQVQRTAKDAYDKYSQKAQESL